MGARPIGYIAENYEPPTPAATFDPLYVTVIENGHSTIVSPNYNTLNAALSNNRQVYVRVGSSGLYFPAFAKKLDTSIQLVYVKSYIEHTKILIGSVTVNSGGTIDFGGTHVITVTENT